MLGQDTPDEGDDHHQKFVERPEPDQLGVIQMLWNGISIHRGPPSHEVLGEGEPGPTARGQVAGRALAALVPGRGAASDVGPRDGPTGLASAWRLLRWLPLTQLVYGIATVRAALARRVEWRGVVYEVRSGGVARLSRPAPSGA